MSQLLKTFDILTNAALAIWTAMLVSLLPGQSFAQVVPKSPDIGVYVWGGLLNKGEAAGQLSRSVDFLLDQGFASIRFATTRSAGDAYRLNLSGCPDKRPDLTCFLRQQLGSRTFDDPRLTSLYITLEDTGTDWKMIGGKGIPTQAKLAMRAEYDAAFDYLAKRFSHHPIPITILNWEGDNEIYCGAAYQFATQAAFRKKCLLAGDPAPRLSRFVDWMDIRQQAVNAANRRHPGLVLRIGYEVNNLRMFSRDCQPAGQCGSFATVLEAVGKARKHVPLCSYSAYDSLNHETLALDLPLLLTICEKLILGEVGFRLAGNNMQAALAKHTAFIDAIRPYIGRISAIIYWNGFESSTGKDLGFGLFTNEGKPLMINAVMPSLAKLR